MTTVVRRDIIDYRKEAYKMPKVTRSYEVKTGPTTIRLTDNQAEIVKKYMLKWEISKSQAIGELIEKGHELEKELSEVLII